MNRLLVARTVERLRSVTPRRLGAQRLESVERSYRRLFIFRIVERNGFYCSPSPKGGLLKGVPPKGHLFVTYSLPFGHLKATFNANPLCRTPFGGQ